MRLFMQASGATVELPGTSSADGAFTVSETVGFRDSVVVDNSVSAVDSVEEDIWKSIDLDRIDIVAQRKSIERVMERNGEVTLMFYVKAPKALLDSCWKLTIHPELIEKDSSVLLSPVILRGKEFIRMQENQYKAYDDFLRGIIPESKYDSAFVDREGIRKDIFARQRLFWKVYEAERRRRLAYLKWKTLMDKRHGWISTKVEGNRNSLKQHMQRDVLERSVEKFIAGYDTVGIRASYQKKYDRRTGFWPAYRLPRAMTVKDVPSRFQELWLSGGRLEDIRNYSFTRQDSVEIASHRYFRRAIAENEYNRDHQDLIRDRIIRFPYADSAMVNQTANPSEDFSYLYTYRIPVCEGMKKLHITLRGNVLATDHSVWSLLPADTLTFVIASVADLADVSLARRFDIAGDSVNHITPEREEYAQGLEALSNREYQKALGILEKYPDYNTAVALTCLGYHAKSEELLKQLPQTAAVEYLRAIVNARLEDYQTAAELLLEACRKDDKYVYRTEMDSDIVALLPRFMGLKEELERIASEE
ncbi:hypothetical protein K0F10_18040 [Bacteroides fragilis]|nr:hypothetical protein [Bacteroides fragilis]MCE8701388.1 hypothetical protein [Bacteroides fragilis]MCE8706319.1 hypothetical protein [Bacteroides fragilis]MCE9327459.1 hypothetical protein [Bacteroides fragilis]MCE9449139.1 hypothetical protein [Bacteroides fragilis]